MPSVARRLALVLPCLVALLVAPSVDAAVPVTVTATPESVSVPAGGTVDVVLHGSTSDDGSLAFSLVTQPARGSVQLRDDFACTYPNAATTCTITARITSTSATTTSDSFTYRVTRQGGFDSEPATVSVTTTGTTPTITAATAAAPSAAWSGSAGSLLPGATVAYGDGGTATLTPDANGNAALSHQWLAAGSYTVVVSNNHVTGTVRTPLTVVVAVAPAPPTEPSRTVVNGVTFVTQYTTPNVPALPPRTAPPSGLYLNVLDGAIQFTNSTSALNFAVGQFGFTPNFQQPPVYVPRTPGIQFTPSPAFTPITTSSVQISGGTSATVGQSYGFTTPGSVDCEVRSKPRTYALLPNDTDVTQKTYCNAGGPRVGSVSAVHGRDVSEQPKVVPELWYVGADNLPHPVRSSTAKGALAGIDPATGLVFATFDTTSTPKLGDFAKPVILVVVTHEKVTPRAALTRTKRASVSNWPKAGARLRSGATFTCPSVSTKPCVVKYKFVSRQFGVTRSLGSRTVTLRRGATLPLDVPLNASGRWRYATGGIVATLSVNATATIGKLRRAHGTYGVRVAR